MKRLLSLILSLLLALAMPALAENAGLSDASLASLLGKGGNDQPDEAAVEPTAAPTPEPTEAPTPEPIAEKLDGAVLEWNGLSIKPVRYSITAFSSDYVTMQLYFRLLNTTDALINVDVSKVTIDGNENVHGTSIGKAKPRCDSGEDTSEFMLISADYGTGSSSLQAIADARKLNITVVLKDEHFNKLYTQDITVDLGKLEGKRDVPDGFKAVANTPTPSTLSSDYVTLRKGSRGQAVRDMQQRLIDLGYLNDKADGSYGSKTVAAVRLFCEQNGLDVYADGSASPEMQALLFSVRAKSYSEMYNPLTISRGKWEPVKRVNTFFFKAEVTNTSKTRTIKGFELNCYTTNVWGDKLDGGVIYTMSNKCTVAPGKTAWSNSFNLGNWYSVDTVWVGVSRIIFDDGEIRDIDDVSYSSVVLPDKK